MFFILFVAISSIFHNILDFVAEGYEDLRNGHQKSRRNSADIASIGDEKSLYITISENVFKGAIFEDVKEVLFRDVEV